MKIKSDFITNSSSTAYIAFIPPNVDDLVKDIKRGEPYLEWLQDMNPSQEEQEKLIKNVKQQLLEFSIKGGECWAEDDYEIFDIIQSLIWKRGLMLDTLDISGEGQTMIIALNPKILKNIFPYIASDFLKKVFSGSGTSIDKEE